MQNNELEKIIQALSDWAAATQTVRSSVEAPSIPVTDRAMQTDATSGSSQATSQNSLVEAMLSQTVRNVSASGPALSSVSTLTANTSVEGRQPTEAQTESPGSDLRGTTREQVDEIGRLNAQLEQLRRLTTTQAEAIVANTKALESSGTPSKTQTESSGQGIGSKIFSSMLGGFGIGSMISEIVGLFGGGKSSSEVPALVSYSLPSPIRMESGLSPAGATAPVQYSQTGSPRPESPAPSQQVVVQIQALDSRSVLDRSDDIARAVREAMLHSHSLNDVVNDL